MIWTRPDGCRGLIFDCDGTLVDSMPLHFQAWTTVLQRHDLELTRERFYQWAGAPIDEIIRRLADEKGISVDATAIADERDAVFHSYPESALKPVEAVVEIARHFHRRLPLAVATGSTAASARTSLTAIGVFELFDFVISSRDVGRAKPAPDVFLYAAEQIDIPPKECAVFEDGEAGLDAARAAGMHAVDIRPWLQE